MPTYEYRCNECDKNFDAIHSMNVKLEKCELCGSSDIKKVFCPVFFTVTGGTPKFGTNGYTGRHQDLARKMKDNKNYRDGYRKELNQKEKKGMQTLKEEQKMAATGNLFEKMKAEGEKMTPKEKEQIKQEFGINKKMKLGKI